jgi:hypothetical protein
MGVAPSERWAADWTACVSQFVQGCLLQRSGLLFQVCEFKCVLAGQISLPASLVVTTSELWIQAMSACWWWLLWQCTCRTLGTQKPISDQYLSARVNLARASECHEK